MWTTANAVGLIFQRNDEELYKIDTMLEHVPNSVPNVLVA